MAKWISVKDKLPEHGSCCYIFTGDNECDSFVWRFTDDKRGKIWASVDGWRDQISSYSDWITHWMPHEKSIRKGRKWSSVNEKLPAYGDMVTVMAGDALSPSTWWLCEGDADGGGQFWECVAGQLGLNENVITHWMAWKKPKPPKIKKEPEEVDEVCEAIQCPTCNEITTSSKSAKMIADDGVCGICGTGNSLDDQLFAFGLNRDDLAEMGEHAWWSLQHEVGHKG
jgi:hypothetical protein